MVIYCVMKPSTTLLDDAKTIFDSFVLSGESFIPKTDLGAYKLALDMETKSSKFYGEAAANENDPETKKLLLKIAEEEHKHYQHCPVRFLRHGVFFVFALIV